MIPYAQRSPGRQCARFRRRALYWSADHHQAWIHRGDHDTVFGKRGTLTKQHYLTQDRVELTFELPLPRLFWLLWPAEIHITGLRLFDYTPINYRQSDLVKLDIKLNNENVDALSALVHRDKAYAFGRKICAKTKGSSPTTAVHDSHSSCYWS